MSVHKPTEGHFHAPLPSKGVVFMRSFLPWQIYRFIRINYKMVRMISKSHH